MIRYLIKNNFKLMARSKTNFLLFVITPLILIALLSSAFNDLMKKYEGDVSISAGYRIDDDTSTEILDALKDAAEEGDVELKEYSNGDPEDLIKEEDLGAFVVFNGDSYKIYQNDKNKEEGKALEYMINAFYDRVVTATVTQKTEQDVSSSDLRIENPDYMPPIESTDYYGIIEIVYFGWCAIVCGAGVFMNEKKYRIRKKLRVSSLSETQQYMAKYIPMVMVVSVGTLLSTALSILLFGVHWGNPLLSAVIVVLSTAAATALGLMVYSITDNMVVTIISVFSLVWFAGFFGGSFETYMFSAHSMSVKMASPIYHINRALVELSCMGHSDFVGSAIGYSLAIIVVCTLIGIFAGTIRKRGKA